MTKTEFIAKIAEKTKVSKKQAGEFVEAFTETVTEVLTEGDKIALIGFGTFETVVIPEHNGKNPATGEDMVIPERTRAKFSAGKSLKDSLNN